MLPSDTDPTVTAAEALRMAASILERTQPLAEPPPTLPRWLRASEVAAVLSLSTKHVYDLIARGILPSVRINRAVRVPEDRLRAYMVSLTTPTRPSHTAPSDQRPARLLPRSERRPAPRRWKR